MCGIFVIGCNQNYTFFPRVKLGSKYDNFTTTMMKPLVPNYSKIILLLQSYEIRTQAHEASIFSNQSIAFIGQ